MSGSTGGVNVEALVKLDRPAARAMKKLSERIPGPSRQSLSGVYNHVNKEHAIQSL